MEPLNLHGERYMSDNNIELTRRRVLGGIATVGAASAAVGAGTFAAFSDTETSSGNSVTAGTLDLQLNPNSSGSTSIDFGTIAPGDSGYLVIELTNDGSIDATLQSINIGDVSEDGSLTESLTTNSDGEDPNSDGELDDYLEIGVFIEADDLTSASVGTTTGETVSATDGTRVISSDTKLSDAVGRNNGFSESLTTNETKYLVLNYELPREETGNVVQGDSAGFDIQIVSEQASN